MELTIEAKEELDDLHGLLAQMQIQKEKLIQERKNCEWHLWNAINKEIRSIEKEQEKMETKISCIEKTCISSKQKQAIKRTVTGSGKGYTIIATEKNIFNRSITYVGYSKELESFVHVVVNKHTVNTLKKHSSYVEVEAIRITKEEYNNFIAAGRTDRVMICSTKETHREIKETDLWKE